MRRVSRQRVERLDHDEAVRRILAAMRARERFAVPPGTLTLPASAVSHLFQSPSLNADLGVHGVSIEGAVIEGEIDLAYVRSEFPLQLADCTVDSLIAKYATLRFLDLSGSRLKQLDATRATLAGDVNLRRVQVHSGCVRLDGARIGGDLMLNDAVLANGDQECLSIEAAQISGAVDASGGGLRAHGIVNLSACQVNGLIDLTGAKCTNPGAHTIRGPQARLASDLVLRGPFTSDGEIDLQGAVIEGQLRLGGASLSNPGQDALSCDSIVVKNGVSLIDEFEAHGGVRFLGATVGQVNAQTAVFKHDQECLNLDQATCQGGLFLDNATFEGNVQMIGLVVNGQINLCGSTVVGDDRYLYLDHVDVDGEVLLTDLRAPGARVMLRHAAVSGQLNLGRANLGRGLDASDAKLAGGMSLREANLVGTVRFNDADLSSTIDLRKCLRLSKPSGPAGPVPLSSSTFSSNARVLFDGGLALDQVVIQSPVTLIPGVRGPSGTTPGTTSNVAQGGRAVVSGSVAATSVPAITARLTSLSGATLQAPLVIGDGVDMGRCLLTGALGLENLHITAANPGWTIFRRRRTIHDETEWRAEDWTKKRPARTAGARGVESTYRQLRAALEASKAAPAAADFYYGEMEMRRAASRSFSSERVLLNLYKATSGYGLRIWRSAISYLVVINAIAVLLRWCTGAFVVDERAAAGLSPNTSGIAFDHYLDVLAIVARTSGGFLSPVPVGMTALGTALLLVSRLLVPALIALALLALRAKVQR